MTASNNSRIVKVLGVLGLVLVAAAAGAGLYAKSFIARNRTAQYDNPVELFKYGSIGTEERYGMPLLIWRAMPTLCKKTLPSYYGRTGWENFGFLYERPDSPVPIGVSVREKPIPRIGLNCAACHTASYREAPKKKRQFILRSPAHQFDLEGYIRFVFRCVSDKDFTDDNLIAEMKRDPSFGRLDELIYRRWVIPETRASIARREDEFKWLQSTLMGIGRFDMSSLAKHEFGLSRPDDVLGPAKFTSLYLKDKPGGYRYGWDGSNTSPVEIARLHALLAGATPESIEIGTIDRLVDWVKTQGPYPYPYPSDIHTGMVGQGKAVFERTCAGCHVEKVGQVVDLHEVGTDPHRVDAASDNLIAFLNGLGEGKPWKLGGFQSTTGYQIPALDGIWARAPYLHNGSAGTLRDLLTKPADRSPKWVLGFDAYDYEHVGFRSYACHANERGECFLNEVNGTVTLSESPGNAIDGHPYGTDLPPPDIDALVEYLKTL